MATQPEKALHTPDNKSTTQLSIPPLTKLQKVFPIDQIPQMLLGRIAFLDSILQLSEERLKGAPEGTLRISSQHHKIRYYHVLNQGKKSRSYIKKENLSIVPSLCQKEYDLSVMKALRIESVQLKKLLKTYESQTFILPENIFKNLSPARKMYVQSFNMSDEDYRRYWESIPYTPKSFGSTDPNFRNRRGDRVRSKSEIIISNTLDDLGIPFRYEAPIILKNGRVIHPDFTILNVRTRKTYYLEHLGKMDDGSYSETQMYRISDYQDSGIFLGEKLLITYETQAQPFDGEMLRPLIEKYFL